MGRKLLTLAVAASLVLSGMTVALWVRSFSADDHLGRLTIVAKDGRVGEQRYGIFSSHGRISIAEGRRVLSNTDYPRYTGSPLPDSAHRFGWWGGAFDWFHGERDATFVLGFGSNSSVGDEDRYGVVSVPHWFVALFLSTPVVHFIFAATGRRRYSAAIVPLAYAVLLGVGVLMVTSNGVLGVYLFPALFLVGSLVAAAYVGGLPSRAARRAAAGLCPSCGYDLRASPDRCPECGAVPAKVSP